MGYSIRGFNFDSRDFAIYAEIMNAIDPEHPVTVEDLKHYIHSLPANCTRQAFVADVEGRPVGCSDVGCNSFSYHPRKFGIMVRVLEDARGTGIGSALFEACVEAVEPLSPMAFRCAVREDWPHSLRFAAKRGFEEKMREWESALDMASYDPVQFAHLGERASAEGITIKSAAQLAGAGTPDWQARIHEVEMQTLADVPMTDVFTPPTFEDWSRMTLESPNFEPNGYFVAVDGDTFVATSALWRGARETSLETGLTGVLSDYRRKGIATALKLHALAYAKKAGVAEVRTDNATTNRAMLSINELLGFQKRPGTVFMVKTICEEAGDDD